MCICRRWPQSTDKKVKEESAEHLTKTILKVYKKAFCCFYWNLKLQSKTHIFEVNGYI